MNKIQSATKITIWLKFLPPPKMISINHYCTQVFIFFYVYWYYTVKVVID